MSTHLADVVDAFLAELVRTGELRPRTRANYCCELRAAAELLTAPLDHLSACDLDRFLTRGAVTPGTVTMRQATLRRFFAWAARMGWCSADPLAGSTLRRPPVQLPRPIPPDDRAALDAALDARLGQMPTPYALLLAVLRETGVRPHEALALRRSDASVTPGGEVLRIWTAAHTAVRSIPLSVVATPHTLERLRIHVPSGGLQLSAAPLAESPRGGRVSYDALNYQWSKLCAVAGLLTAPARPRYTLHQLRDTRGCELIAQGMPLAEVQRLLGHRDHRSTLGYRLLATDTGAPADAMAQLTRF